MIKETIKNFKDPKFKGDMLKAVIQVLGIIAIVLFIIIGSFALSTLPGIWGAIILFAIFAIAFLFLFANMNASDRRYEESMSKLRNIGKKDNDNV